ncbi:LysR family transcriptional regulator [Magnetospirillum molischianum]|uniref:Putative transcriptional regulatory protein, LysR family n=1 Tax=Magnetospirillum molischianum DSM 120 TaxID=1150626 RepID=H8FPX3_MAGML|nr:LysR family transcriptional regulator [Magnetospirillum molischianum]CCG40411.1 putative transcriptional regulatory protein, LysR family [Magnetospirillum molischianum DSM 120]
MTLDQIKVFVAVAESLHVTRAAQALGLTQSAASASIAALEARYGLALFDRIGRHIELTQAGRLFLPEAKAMLALANRAETMLADLSGLRRGHLDLYASQTIAGYWLPPWLHRFRERYPDITVSLTIGNTRQVARAVREGTADLGFVEGDIDDPILARLSVPGDRLVMAVGSGHPLAGAKDVTPAEIIGLAWVLREAGSGTRQIFEAALGEYGIDPRALTVAMELPSNEAVRSAVEAGAGVTVISHLVVESALRAGRLATVGLPFPLRSFTVIRHGDRHRAKAKDALLALIRDGLPSPTETEAL